MTSDIKHKSIGLASAWSILGQKDLCDKYQTRFETRDYLMNHRLPFAAMKNLSEVLKINLPEEGESVFGLGRRTFARRRQARKLPADESVMVFRIAEVVVTAIDAFGDVEKAIRWLHKPCRALGGRIPLHLLRDDIGRGIVEDELGRIEFGIYS